MKMNHAENQDLHQCRGSSEMESRKGEWSSGAIFSLLDAYEVKWNERNKGNLCMADWEEVSVAVSSRCNGSKSPKTSTQCRDKIEGLKKRYRLEATHLSTVYRSARSSWPFFVRMDSLLRPTNKSVQDFLPGGLGLRAKKFSELPHQTSLSGHDAHCLRPVSLFRNGTGHGKHVPLRADDDGTAPVLSVGNVCQAPFSHLQLLQGNEDLCRHALFPQEEEQDEDEVDALQEAKRKHTSMSKTVLDKESRTVLGENDVRQAPFSHLQLLHGNEDLCMHALFPEEDDQNQDEEDDLAEAESKHDSLSKKILGRKTKTETSRHGYSSARPLTVDEAVTAPANEAARANQKPCMKQKTGTNEEVLASIRTFAESILKLEHAKMEIYKDAERLRAEAEARRAELELRRTQMIMTTQLEIAKLLASSSSSSAKKSLRKKLKRKKGAKGPPKNCVMPKDAEPLSTGMAEMHNGEAIPSSQSASGIM